MVEHMAQTLRVLELAGLMVLESGGETYRVEETVQRMGEGFGYPDTRVLCTPTGVYITVCEGGAYHTLVRRVKSRGTDLARVDAVNRISRRVSTGDMMPAEALEALEGVLAEAPEWWGWRVVLSALGAGGFALMLGGGLDAFLVAMLCGVTVHGLAGLLARLDLHLVLKNLLGGFVCAGLAVMAHGWFGVDMEPVIAGALMPLIPGLAMNNAVRDTMRGDLLSGVTRGVEALLVAILLAAGVVMALWLGGRGGIL